MKTTTKLISTIAVMLTITTAVNAGYVGASVGYMVDAEDEIFFINSGTAFSKTPTSSHNFELELGYTSSSDRYVEDIEGYTMEIGGDFEVIPVLANYVYNKEMAENITLYGGVGAGYSFYDFSTAVEYMGEYYIMSDSGGNFTYQAMIGVEFDLTPYTTLKIGYRYFCLDDLNLVFDDLSYEGDLYDGADAVSSEDITLDDSVIEVGLVYKF